MHFDAHAIAYQPSGALRSARDHSIEMSDIGGGFSKGLDKWNPKV
jgi:hypothetical protein